MQRALALVCALAAWSVALPAADAAPFLPPAGKLFAGEVGPVSTYEAAVHKHPAVYQEFVSWGQYLPALTGDAQAAHARLMVHISTLSGTSEQITPAQIASGAGDVWLTGLSRVIAASGNITYVRLMAEMDGYWNPYAAFNASGAPRDAAHSTPQFKRAWKRVALILRGGPVAHLDAVLSRLGEPPLTTAPASDALPTPKVAMLWVPQVAGAPDIAGNEPRDYFPGRPFVDWVGTDFYANAPNFAGLERLYDAFPGYPFVFGEYALWGSDDPGSVQTLFAWIAGHPRTRMVIYNQGMRDDGPFRLSHYPAAAAALRRALAGARFPAFAPEWR